MKNYRVIVGDKMSNFIKKYILMNKCIKILIEKNRDL